MEEIIYIYDRIFKYQSIEVIQDFLNFKDQCKTCKPYLYTDQYDTCMVQKHNTALEKVLLKYGSNI